MTLLCTAALLIMSPLPRPFLPPTSITTSPLVLFAMPRIQQRLFPLRVSSASDDIILAPQNVNPNAIDSTSEVEEFRYKQMSFCGTHTGLHHRAPLTTMTWKWWKV